MASARRGSAWESRAAERVRAGREAATGVAGLLTFEIGLERALVREQHGGFECLVTLSSLCACLGRLTSGNNLPRRKTRDGASA